MIGSSDAKRVMNGRRKAKRTLVPFPISQAMRRAVVATSPQAARKQGESCRVTGQSPGVAFDLFLILPRRADVYEESEANVINNSRSLLFVVALAFAHFS